MKAVRKPIFWYALVMWLVSFLLSGLLIQLGGLVMSDVPTAARQLTKSDFVDQTRLTDANARIKGVDAQIASTDGAINDAKFALSARRLDYNTQQTNFENWIKTRSALENSNSDPEVALRLSALQTLKQNERNAQQALADLEQNKTSLVNEQAELEQAVANIRRNADEPYRAALKWEEFKVFLLRLGLTLPLLLISIWLVVKQRKSTYWPVARAFVMFSLFAFFVELVPYLPSYGGYIRLIVGIALSLLFVHFAVRGMNKYLARKKTEEQRPESEKRKDIGYENAVKKISDGVCPSCDRQYAAKSPKGELPNIDYCVHCGFCLYKKCNSCDTRSNSFYKFCGSCGVDSKET